MERREREREREREQKKERKAERKEQKPTNMKTPACARAHRELHVQIEARRLDLGILCKGVI